MPSARPLAALAACALAVLALAACSSSAAPAPSRTASSSPVSGPPAGLDQLERSLKQGVDGIRTAELTATATLFGANLSGSGPAQYRAGELVATDLSGTVEGVGALRVVSAGGKLYAQVPPAENHTGKPWLLVQENSSNIVAAQLANALSGIQTAASLNKLEILVAAARTLTRADETLRGAPVTHYTFQVDGSKLPNGFPERSEFVSGALQDSPTDLWLDAAGRPVQVKRVAIVSGQPVPVTVAAVKFNEPVQISAPPAGQVATG